MSKKIIRGKFPYHDPDKEKKKSKKELKKEARKLWKLKDKELTKQCECNHLDSKKNKAHFKMSEDGNYKICKICGGRIISNPEFLTVENVESAVETIYSVYAYVRNRMKLSSETDDVITQTLKINSRAPELLSDILEDDGSDSHEKKHGHKHDKGHKKNKHKKLGRIKY